MCKLLKPWLICVLAWGGICPITSAEPHRFATVPALGVAFNGAMEVGHVHYIIVQLDQDRHGRGPTILFAEQSLGSAVGEGWKEAARTALIAAASAVGADPRHMTVTIKNRTYNLLTEGPSASSAVAVGIMAAWRGETVRSDVVLT
jgi:hypothetical protein